MFRVGLVILTLVACHRDDGPEASPLGKISQRVIDEWATECGGPVIQEHVCNRGAWTPMCLRASEGLDGFPSHAEKDSVPATRRIWCRPPHGWSIWTTDDGRIRGICVDEARWSREDRGAGHPKKELALTRFTRLLNEHLQAGLAHEIATWGGDPERSLNDGWNAWGESPGVKFRRGSNGALDEDWSEVPNELDRSACVSVPLAR